MTAQTDATLKGYFAPRAKPTSANFGDLIDSMDLSGIVNVKDPTYGALGDGDDTVPIQAAIGAAVGLTTSGAVGRRAGVWFPPAKYKCNIVLQENVVLLGNAELAAFATGAVIDTPATLIHNPEVHGLTITGFGGATAAKGVRFRNVTRGIVRDCRFNNFADQAILHEDGAVCWFVDNFAQNCLLDRTQAAKSGVLQIDSLATDDFVVRGEYTASSSQEGTVSDANLRICGGKISGTAHYIDGTIFEINDVGLYLDAIRSRVNGVRCDLNYGHGFEIAGLRNQLMNCYSLNNSQDTTNTYDGYSVTAGSGQYTGCKAESNVTNDHRYGFNDTVNSDSSKNKFNNCESEGHATAGWNTQNFAGASVTFPAGPPKSFASGDTTPSVDQYGAFRTVNAAPTTITNFDDGVSGQEIVIRFADANTTIDFTASNLKGNAGVDWTPTLNSSLRGYFDGTNWYCSVENG